MSRSKNKQLFIPIFWDWGVSNKLNGKTVKNKNPKEPILSLIFTSILPGLGQVYSGYLQRGFLFFIFELVYIWGMIHFSISPTTRFNASIFLLLMVGVVGGLFVLIDSYSSAVRFNKSHGLERKITFAKKAGLIVIAFFFLFVWNPAALVSQYIKNNFIQSFRIPSSAMADTLKSGDRLFVNKQIYKKNLPQRGDVIVFKYPQDPKRSLIKRLIAFGGETVEIKEGKIYIDGKIIDEPRIRNIYYHNYGQYAQKGSKAVVPKNHYFVLGDNSLSSHDSRYWGFVPESYVVGMAFKIFFPFERSGEIK